MPFTEFIEKPLGGPAQLRNEPVQARSTARLTALLDAAAAVVQELGYERLTTAMVADRAGASIGTVYRYFPDRIAVLQALSARNLDRVLSSVERTIAEPAHANWLAATAAAFDTFVAAFRDEPGFRSLRGGDVLDLRPPLSPTTANSTVADAVLGLLSERFGLGRDAESAAVFETAVEVGDGLIARAFARNAQGETYFLDTARALSRSILINHFGDPR